jgi:hypothetical protein
VLCLSRERSSRSNSPDGQIVSAAVTILRQPLKITCIACLYVPKLNNLVTFPPTNPPEAPATAFGNGFKDLPVQGLPGANSSMSSKYLKVDAIKAIYLVRFPQCSVFLIPSPIIGIRTLWLVSYSRYLWLSNIRQFCLHFFHLTYLP